MVITLPSNLTTVSVFYFWTRQSSHWKMLLFLAPELWYFNSAQSSQIEEWDREESMVRRKKYKMELKYNGSSNNSSKLTSTPSFLVLVSPTSRPSALTPACLRRYLRSSLLSSSLALWGTQRGKQECDDCVMIYDVEVPGSLPNTRKITQVFMITRNL